MQRAFALDVLVRPPWGGSLRVLGTVEEPGAVRPDSDPPCLAYVWTPAGHSTVRCAQLCRSTN
jgi:hypothetical protein